MSLVKQGNDSKSIKFHHKQDGMCQPDSTAVDQLAEKVKAYRAKLAEKPATERKSSSRGNPLQSSLRQLAKICELLARNAELDAQSREILESTISEVRKHTTPAPAKAK